MKNPHISKSGADFGKGPMVIKIEYNEIYNIIKTTVLYSLKSKHFECFNEQTAYSNTIVFIKILVELSKLFQKLYQGTSMNFNILVIWS